MQKCIYVYMHICIHVYTCIYVYMYICTYVSVYIQTYIHTYIYTYIHVYIHTYIHTCIPAYMHTYALQKGPRLDSLKKRVRTRTHTLSYTRKRAFRLRYGSIVQLREVGPAVPSHSLFIDKYVYVI